MITDNKTLVLQALGSLLENRNTEVLSETLHDDFIHHRPDSDVSKAEWLDRVEFALTRQAGIQVEITHAMADGDLVAIHSVRRLPDGPEITVVDILRLENGLVAEAWETIEPTAQAQANLRWWETASSLPAHAGSSSGPRTVRGNL